MTNYPASIDSSISLPLATDTLTPVSGITVNRLRAAILAIETELGVKPSGLYSNVGGRFNTLESNLSALQIINLSGDLGGTLLSPKVIGIQGRPISSATPNYGDVLTWNGIAWEPNPTASGFAGGDLSGIYPNPTVIGIQGKPISSSSPNFNNALTWDGSKWTPKEIVPNPNYLTQTQWYIDSINGNNNNDGLTPATALQTANELDRRIGQGYVLKNNVTITLLNDLLTTDTLHLENIVSNDGYFVSVKGVEKVVTSGTFTNVRQFNHAGNIQWGVESTNIGSFAPHIKTGRYIRKTSGPNAGISGFWPAKDENGTMCRISQPAYRPANDLLNCYLEPLNIGDTFNIVDFPKVYNVNFSNTPGLFPLYLENIAIVGSDLNTISSTVVTLRECSFSNLVAYIGCGANLPNCQISSDTLSFNFYVSETANIHLTYGLLRNCRINVAGRLGLSNYTLLQGCLTYTHSAIDATASGGITCHTRGFGIYDSPASGLIVAPWHQNYIAGTIWGSNNDGYGIEVMPGGLMTVGGLGYTAGAFFLVQGNLGDILVSNKSSGPAVTTTNPYSYTADRVYSYTNFNNNNISTGGFAQKIIDPLRPMSGITTDY